ncbi:MAG: cytochrome c oxidase subunit II [Bacillota bacterium]|nr:cytochrome c oxidase subunit II [Bacillota bacterium]
MALVPLALAAAALLGGCGTYPQSDFNAVGPVSQLQRSALVEDMRFLGVIGIIVIGLVVYAALRFRHRPGQEETPAQIEGNPRLEIAWWVVIALGLVFLVVPPLRDEFVLAGAPKGPGVVHVKVIGHQWWWEFQYPDYKFVTANEMHIPVGAKVDLEVTSVDVIHSFWAPNIAGTLDAIPGRINSEWIQADKPGVYWGQCKEFCGLNHANMRLRVVAESPEDFQKWVESHQHPVGVSQLTGEALAGWQVFDGPGTCKNCHTIDGTDAKGVIGPNLTGIGSRVGIGAMTLVPNDTANLVRWLHDPQSVKPGNDMIIPKLSDQQIRELVAFLQSQKTYESPQVKAALENPLAP